LILFLVLLAIGLIAGLVAGLLGVGGGIIFTPVLYFLFSDAGVENPVLWTIGSGLFCTFVAAVGSAVRQYVQDNFFAVESLKLGLLGVAGIFAGKLIVESGYYDRTAFVIIFSLILLYAAYMMFRRGQDITAEKDREFGTMGIKEMGVTGGVGGFIAALAGVGGGGIMVPIMNLYYRQPFQKAVSVSSVGMTIFVAAGWIQIALTGSGTSGITEVTLGNVDFGASLPLSVGGLVGGYAGALLNHKIRRKVLQWFFALLAVGMASRLIWSVL